MLTCRPSPPFRTTGPTLTLLFPFSKYSPPMPKDCESGKAKASPSTVSDDQRGAVWLLAPEYLRIWPHRHPRERVALPHLQPHLSCVIQLLAWWFMVPVVASGIIQMNIATQTSTLASVRDVEVQTYPQSSRGLRRGSQAEK